jgi:P-type conjugative transfer protein TrbG
MHRPHYLSSILLLATSLLGCASTPPARRPVAAQPLRDPPRPPTVVRVPVPMPLPGQLRPAPIPHPELEQEKPRGARDCVTEPEAAGAGKKANADACNDTAEVIKKANSRAAQRPTERGFFNAQMVYDYVPGAVFQVYTAPGRFTDIALQVGEKLVGKPATGDNVQWIAAQVRSGEGASEQQHLLIKPVFPGLYTSLGIMTNRRVYLIDLHSFQHHTNAMAAVSWRYPQDEIAQLEASYARAERLEQTATRTKVTVDELDFQYRIKVKSGRPGWTPTQVFDDGAKTFIQFPPSMLNGEAPALFLVADSGETQLVFYRVKGSQYIVDRLFDEAELRVGQQDQEIVRITREAKARAKTPPPPPIGALRR